MGWEAARAATIIGVIRGETALAALAGTGLDASSTGAHPPCHRDATLQIHVTMQDIARGLVAYRTKPEERRDWAWALLSWGFLTITETECWRDPASVGGAVLTALWNAAYQLPINAEIVCTVAQLAAGNYPMEASR